MKVGEKQCYYFSFRQFLYIPERYRIWHLPAPASCATGLYMCVTLCRFPTLFSFTWFTYIDTHSINFYHLMEEMKLHWWRYQCLFIYGLYIHYLFIISIKYNLIMVSTCPAQHKYTIDPYSFKLIFSL